MVDCETDKMVDCETDNEMRDYETDLIRHN